MQKFSIDILSTASDTHLDVDQLRKAASVAWVHNLWLELVEPDIAQHTNRVYLVVEEGIKKLKVYMDDSVYASELNARRELIRLQCAQQFGQVIDEFSIHISRGSWKNEHPFTLKEENLKPQPTPLTAQEHEQVENICSRISDPILRERFKKAMIADLEWMKGISR